MRKNLILIVLFIILISAGMLYSQADLRISIKCPGKAVPGQDLKTSLKVFVTNAGNIPASNFSVDLIISSDTFAPMKFAVYTPNHKEDALLLGGREYVSFIGPGKTIAVKLYGNNRIPADTPSGLFYLGAVVDPGNSVRERNERNNMSFCRISIKGGDSTEARPCGIKFTSMSKNSGYPGNTFKMYGTWGATQGTKIPCINKGKLNKLIVLSWSNSRLKVRIPTYLTPGVYRVGVYCRYPSRKTYGTIWKNFTILRSGSGIKPDRKRVDIDIRDIYLDNKCRIWIRHYNNGTEKLDVVLRERVWVNGTLKTDDKERIVLLPGKWTAHGVGADPGVKISGTATVKAQIDVDNVLAETNEVNNIKTVRLTCKVVKMAVLKPIINPNITILKPLKPTCPDPAAYAINFSIINKFSTFKGKVRITGIVKNVGSKAFSGGGGMAYLYEGNTLRKTKSFSFLGVGATLSLYYERNWNRSSPSEGEFPPTYKLVIQYDPDILMDSNKNNDDCTLVNNSKVRNGAGINDLF